MGSCGGEPGPAGFESFYAAHYRQIAGYVRRRVPGPEAEDVIAHVFQVAWRRFGRIPAPPDDRAWLFGAARNCVADHHRCERRRVRLQARLSEEAAARGSAATAPGSPHEPVRAALARLRPRDREALQLVLWDELTHAEAAAVLGCTVNAFEIRYRRARGAVHQALMAARADPGRGHAASSAQSQGATSE